MARPLDEILDHEYDGIREYDNPLPGWWVAIFWLSFFFSIGYVLWYEVGIGPSVYDDYAADQLAHYAKQAELYKDLEVSDKSIMEFAADADLMNGVAGLFKASCASCHRPDGGGSIGPNLTDDYWLHGGTPMNVYTTIAEGVPAKGMQAWLDQLGPVQVMYLAAYVSGPLSGSNPPNPKAPQGTQVAAAPVE